MLRDSRGAEDEDKGEREEEEEDWEEGERRGRNAAAQGFVVLEEVEGDDEEEESYNLGESVEQDDSFDASLEDTDKTPVVGPEDWRHATPETHSNGKMPGGFEDSFNGPEGSPMPDARPSLSKGLMLLF